MAQSKISVIVVDFKDLARRIQPIEGLIPENWKQHPNGGGWVELSAHVDRDAYVGPGAIVMDEANVLGSSRIEQEATVAGNAIVVRSVVTDRARVGGSAKVVRSNVTGSSDLAGYTVLIRTTVTDLRQVPRSREDRKLWMDTKIPLARRRSSPSL